ncbi:MAG: VWA domain-containing protein [Kofleriaceae bacterium]|nr:VWA domain-containing protein [Kofleriaceae bacterium]MCL4222991.1 VWA domain-containing protein [Myxococcales bacterium]
MGRVLRALFPYVLLVLIGGPIAIGIDTYLEDAERRRELDWQNPAALVLLAAVPLLAWVLFHLRRERGATLAFPRVADLRLAGPGFVTHLAALPAVLRLVAIAVIVVGLARPQTYRTVVTETDSVDIMIVLDLSKSMEETDLRRDRLDAAQRVIRRFAAQRQGDRLGLVLFGQYAMLQCPLTLDMDLFDRVVADLKMDDIPSLGTAIGDGLGMGLAYLRRSDAKSKVVILLSDGDNNVSTQMTPQQAAEAARAAGVKVFTVLVGADSTWGSSVNPATLRNIADVTGGKFFKATDWTALRDSFAEMRKTLDKTRRRKEERKKDKELFVPLVGLAVGLLLTELLLSATRFRRFP